MVRITSRDGVRVAYEDATTQVHHRGEQVLCRPRLARELIDSGEAMLAARDGVAAVRRLASKDAA